MTEINNETLALLIYDPSFKFKSTYEVKKYIISRYQINNHTNLFMNELNKINNSIYSFLSDKIYDNINFNDENYYIYCNNEIINILIKLESPNTKRYYYNKYHTTYNLKDTLPSNQFIIFKTDIKYIPYIYASFMNETDISKHFNYIISKTYNKIQNNYMVVGFDIDRYNNNLIDNLPYSMKQKLFLESVINSLKPIIIYTVIFDNFFTITNFSFNHNININYGLKHKMLPYTSYNEKEIKYNIKSKTFTPRQTKFNINAKSFIPKINKKNIIQQPKK